ncbi:MAG: acetyl-CoA carboxylase biotin carboxylase subunit [Latescibacteria bacterium DG_63]|nr:MAG: acetyl-CoA carboxylase biotin carboxylase subunit [Latescibacteria bacterium DG_63]
MFKRILIANRGEIALRIIRACRELGIETVAVYSEADAASLHVRLADEAICIGPPQASESYLNIPRIVSAAEISDSEAIHPGYGFLAESAEFAEICEASDITFIGPTSENIRKMGDKALARARMAAAGVPILPGSKGAARSVEDAEGVAEKVGYPILIKAVNGGGGKGMRIVDSRENLSNSFLMCKAEAEAAFGSAAVYIEKYLQRPRHIEIQIVGDSQGNIVQLFERDCSVQRRHQKLIEEAPSPALTPELRRRIGEAAVEGAKKIDYESVGTIEFLLDSDLNFYFMEMNTRIQVEHTVTEEVTGFDLVKEQIVVASGGELSFAQKDVSISGHAIECRVNAEDPDSGFQPCPGTISYVHLPGGRGVRVDSHVYAGYSIPTYYDSLIAKIVVHGRDRSEAVERMKRALGECLIEGVKTTIPFYQKVLSHDDFVNGNVDTGFVDHFSVKDGAKVT